MLHLGQPISGRPSNQCRFQLHLQRISVLGPIPRGAESSVVDQLGPTNHLAKVGVQAIGGHGQIDRCCLRLEQIDRGRHQVTIARSGGRLAVREVLQTGVAKRSDSSVEQAQVDVVTRAVLTSSDQSGAHGRGGVSGRERVDDRERVPGWATILGTAQRHHARLGLQHRVEARTEGE